MSQDFAETGSRVFVVARFNGGMQVRGFDSGAEHERQGNGSTVNRVPLGDEGNVVVAVGSQTQILPDRLRQRRPNRMQLRDQRDFAGEVLFIDLLIDLLIDTAQRQFVPDRARKRFVRGDQSVECDVFFAKEIFEASVRGETRRV